MLRPIDTQTIYQQSQEVSNRQQMQKQGLETEQMQFAHLLQKETKQKNEVVKHIEKDEKVDNQLDKKKKQEQGRNKNNKKNPEKRLKSQEQQTKQEKNHFDARI